GERAAVHDRGVTRELDPRVVVHLEMEQAAVHHHRDRAIGVSEPYARRGDGAGAAPGGESLTGAALPDPDAHPLRSHDARELHVRSPRQEGVVLERGAERVESGRRGIVDEAHAVRVADADGGDAKDRARHLDGLRHDLPRGTAAGDVVAAEAGAAHVDRDVDDASILALDAAVDDAARGLDPEAIVGGPAVLAPPAREDAQAVAALLGLAAVGVVDPESGVGVRGRHECQHAVAADAAMAVAQAAHHLRREGEGEARGLDDEIIVAERMPLREYVRHRRRHARAMRVSQPWVIWYSGTSR